MQRGVGLVVDNDSLLAFTMTGGSITDFQKNATSFNRADLNVTGVTITGGGAQTINAQNGIQVANSTGTISGNTITGIGYAGPAERLFGRHPRLRQHRPRPSPATRSPDRTATAPTPRWSASSCSRVRRPNSGGAISGNTISYVDTGIGVYGDITPDGILIENNNVTNIDVTDPYPAGVDFQPIPALTTALRRRRLGRRRHAVGRAPATTVSSGLGGNDMLTGNGGDDSLAGGAGTDTAVYPARAPATRSSPSPTATAGSSASARSPTPMPATATKAPTR